MQLESIFYFPSVHETFFIMLNIVSITIGLCLIVYGLIKQKKHKKSTLATCCMVLGLLTIITHTIQIVAKLL